MSIVKQPLISIAMTVFNAAPFLARSIESLLAQDYENFELIISDNASEDGSSEICQEFAKRDSRIKYYRNATNMGPTRSSYKAVDLCSGDFIMPAVDHDVYHPSFISRLLELLQQDESVVLAYPRTLYIDENDHPIKLMPDVLNTQGLDACQRFSKIIWEISSGNMIYGLYRKTTFNDVWHAHHTIGSDLVLAAKLSLLGSIAQIDEPLFFRRRNRPDADTQEMVKRQLALFVKTSSKALIPWTMLAYEHIKVVRDSNISINEKELLFTDIKNCFPRKFGESMRNEASELLKNCDQIIFGSNLSPATQRDKYLELVEITEIIRYFYPDMSELSHLASLRSRLYPVNQQLMSSEVIPYYKSCPNKNATSPIIAPSPNSTFQSTNAQVILPQEPPNNTNLMRLLGKETLKMYAGDVPDRPEYDGWIGLSLTQADERHIRHDITQPLPFADNSVDAFQAEDVLEHISYDQLVPVINEIFRVLKPGGLFRLSVPDYGCDVLRQRSAKDASGNIIFDSGGGGTPQNPGHVWFPRVESVYRLLEKTLFHTSGEINFLHYWDMDNVTYVTTPIDYSKGLVRRTPDFDDRVKAPYRPMSIVVDLIKGKARQLPQTTHYDVDYFDWQKNIGAFGGMANLFKFREFIKPSDTVIDFGCGGGFLLNNIRCLHKVGIEVNPEARQQASKLGIHAYAGTCETADDFADIIISNHALEHVHSPLEELKQLHRKLKAGGLAVFVVPHQDVREAFNSQDINQHLYTWNQLTLGNLFKTAGFTVQRVEALQHQWPENYREIFEKCGEQEFHRICHENAVKNSNYQIRIVATK